MEAKIAADAPLDYVRFQILADNRYDACIFRDGEEEIIGQGFLDKLLEHLPYVKNQVAKEPCDRFKLELPDNVVQKAWFTKATLRRFLHLIGCPDSLDKSVAISKEMSQLQDTRKFHLSLYTKAEDGIMSSDSSKNELLRAMDSRLAALGEELVSTFNMVAGTAFSFQDLLDLQTFFQHFGDEDTRNLLSMLSEMGQKGFTIVPLDNEEFSFAKESTNGSVIKAGVNIQVTGSLNSVKPVIYNASPAKAAEVERQSSTGSEDSSFSSEDDQPSVERSRTLVRSASPRRSASPMRRIQIGRSGSRRTPGLTIKSLTCFPARERISFHRDSGNDCNLGDSEEPSKKTEINVTRMSVQDAISLFERKQRDQSSDPQKKAFVDSTTNASKSVLRRWSAGMGESRNPLTQNTSENMEFENNSSAADQEALKDINPDINLACEKSESPVSVKVDAEYETSERTESHLNKDEVPVSQQEKIDEKLDSAEWSRQKEAELSQMLMKFVEYKNADLDIGKKRNSTLKQRGGFYGNLKEKKVEKIQREKAGKRVQSEIRSKQKVLDEPKAENFSLKVSDVGKKHSTSRILTINKTSLVSSSSRKESLKPTVQNNASSKSSTLPATRKSWPSTPSPRVTGASPAKNASGTTPPGISGSRPKPQSSALRQKPQSPAPLRPSPKLEKPLTKQKEVKKVQVQTKKNLKRVDSKNRVAPKSGKTTKTKTGMATEEAGTSPAKAVVRKVTKKSSVVPVEAKPLSRKVSGTSPASNSLGQKIEIPAQAEETLSEFEDSINIQGTADDQISFAVHPMGGNAVSETHNGHLESVKEIEIEKPEDGSKEEISSETPARGDEIAETSSQSRAGLQSVQEPFISPAAWVESCHPVPSIPSGNSTSTSNLNHDIVASSGTRIRHSLSQMLLEETSEPDAVEWGNAENPPTMVYQKDAPKGLKRLLKFARKSKGEANGTAWASPYTSEGEDDGDEAKSLGKRNSENLLRKVALHSKNSGEGFLSDSGPLSARSNVSNSSARSTNKFQEGHASSKGTRSFFSLSAFRGNKN